MEKIGKVKLDYSAYVEDASNVSEEALDELLTVARDRSVLEYPSIIEESSSFSMLYQLSSIRENIVRWLPITKDMKVLEVGSDCGAVTGALCELAGQVTSIENSKKKCMINAHRHSDCDNLTIYAGRFEQIEKNLDSDYDFICLIGILSKAESLVESDAPQEALIKLLMKHLKKDGRIAIATENRLGMKYLAGCKDDLSERFFGSIEGNDESTGKYFSKQSLNRIFSACGADNVHYYYPYPDYKFMSMIFSDKRLPKKGELTDNIRNFDYDRMVLFDESRAYDRMIEDGIFDQYSNSYMIILGADTEVEYSRFSNDRLPQYAIETSILKKGNEERVVRKRALSKLGDEHIKCLKTYHDLLSERYLGSKLSVNQVKLINENDRPVAYFEYVNGTSLNEIMNGFSSSADNEGFMEKFKEYVEITGYNEGCGVTDKDLVFSNIICEKDKWTLIDYEWTEKKNIPVRETAFRSIYCYSLENKSANKLNHDLILKELGLSDEAAQEIIHDEVAYQKRITGNRLSLGEIRERIGNKILDPLKLSEKVSGNEEAYRFQIYRINKEGSFSEENSYFYKDAYESDTKASVDIELSADEKVVRLDPLMTSCMVEIILCTYNGVAFPVKDKKFLGANGKRVGDDAFIFATGDPNLEFYLDRLPKVPMNILHVEMKLTVLDAETASKISESIKRLF